MTGPRLSIIPAGAVTDRSLEGRDLQVLCLFGRHTEKGGWCIRSQVKIANELCIGRATVQRSVERLVAAGWVEKKRLDQGSGKPFASFAYRVRLDTDQFLEASDDDLTDESASSQSYAETANREGGCPPVGRGAHESAESSAESRDPSAEHPCPGVFMAGKATKTTDSAESVGTGCPRMRGHMNVEEEEMGESESARAREPLISEAATKLADECLIALGLDPENPPEGWYGLAYDCEVLIKRGCDPPLVVATFANFRGTGKPKSYVLKAVNTAHQNQSGPYAKTRRSGDGSEQKTDWRSRRDAKHEALAELHASVERDKALGEGSG